MKRFSETSFVRLSLSLVAELVLELLRLRLYALGLRHTAQDDLDRLCHDPALKLAVWDSYGDQTAEERFSSQPHSRG